MVAIDTLFVLRAGALALLALGSGLVLLLVNMTDSMDEEEPPLRRPAAPEAPDPLRRAA